MSSSCGKRIFYPRKLEGLPKKFKDRVFHEIFKEEKIKADEVFEKSKSQNTNHHLLINKPPKLCDSSGNRKIMELSIDDKHQSDVAEPYMKFMKSSERQIIRWKSNVLPDLSEFITDLTICEKMDLKVEQIIKEFADFWTELGSDCCDLEKERNAETLRRMFSIDFDEHIARALVNMPKEMMCVPNQVATANCTPEASISVILKKIIEYDILAEQEEKKLIGFGRSLPKELANMPPNNNTKQRWVDIDEIPPDIVDMSAVWEGITHLTSTYDYHNWLKEKWEKSRPPYLAAFYDNNPDIEPICNVKDIMEKYQISETMLPVLRDEDQEDIEDLKKKAFENL